MEEQIEKVKSYLIGRHKRQTLTRIEVAHELHCDVKTVTKIKNIEKALKSFSVDDVARYIVTHT